MWNLAPRNITSFFIRIVPKQKKTRIGGLLSQNRASGSSMLSAGGSGFLQLIPISVVNEKRRVETITLCVTGSTVPSMDKVLVHLMKLKDKESVMLVAGIHGLSDMTTEILSAKIDPSESAGAAEEFTYCSHPNVNVGDKIIHDFTEMKANYANLNNLPDIKVSSADVNIILDQDDHKPDQTSGIHVR